MWVRSLVWEDPPGGVNDTPLHSFSENPMDRGAWQATVHGIAKSRTQLNERQQQEFVPFDYIHLIPLPTPTFGSHIYLMWLIFFSMTLFVFEIMDPQHCYFLVYRISSVQFSSSVVSDSLRPHELQHARPPCPSPTPGVHSNSCPSSQ